MVMNMKNKKTIKKVSIISALIALSVVLSLFDGMISGFIMAIFPLASIIPRFKLGIANIVIIVIFTNYGFKNGLIAVILKSALLGLFNASGFITGTSGAMLSYFMMYVIYKMLNRPKSLIFVSGVGGFFHTFGQLVSGFLYYGLFDTVEVGLTTIVLYSPFLLLVGALTGFFMGFISSKVNNIIRSQHIIINDVEKKVLFIGHRGTSSKGGVENTLSAFKTALKLGFDGIETDVRVTLDNQFIVFHDNTLERLTNFSSKKSLIDVNKATFKELEMVQLSQKVNEKVVFDKVTLFKDYLAICKKNQKIPVIELKWTNGINSSNDNSENYDFSNLDRLVEMIQDYGLFDKAYIMTSMVGCLLYLREKYKVLKLQLLCSSKVEEYISICLKNNINLDVNFEFCTKEIVDLFHSAGLLVNIWTLNDKTLLNKYLEMGVDMITSDTIAKK